MYVTIDAPPDLRPKALYALYELLEGGGFSLSPARDGVPRIHYGPTRDGADVHLPMHPEAAHYFADVRPGQYPDFGSMDTPSGPLPTLFHDAHGFDLVAASFFWLSGWPEFVRRDRDEHGRVTWDGSIQQRLASRPWPFVDAYREVLLAQLDAAGLTTNRGSRPWHFCVTHDIDYVRKWTRGIVHRTGSRWIADSAFRSRFRLRANPILDASMRMLSEILRLGGRSTWFFKAGGRDARDVRYDLGGRHARRILEPVVEAGMEIGLHPSYHAMSDPKSLISELYRLEAEVGRSVLASRQHYLRTDLPRSARHLSGAGIRIDATQGFPDKSGYRNGTTHPFRIFDIARNAPLDLIAVPLAFMDASLFNRENLTLDEAVSASSITLLDAQRFGGVCMGLWHNVLWDEGDYPGWGEHFVRTIDAAVSGGAVLSTVTDAVSAQRPSSASILAMPV